MAKKKFIKPGIISYQLDSMNVLSVSIGEGGTTIITPLDNVSSDLKKIGSSDNNIDVIKDTNDKKPD